MLEGDGQAQDHAVGVMIRNGIEVHIGMPLDGHKQDIHKITVR